MKLDDDPLLKESNVMLVALKTAVRGPTTREACVARLTNIMRRAGDTPPDDMTPVHRHVATAFHYLCMAGLLDPDEDGVCTITRRGRDVLHDHPTGIDTSVLIAFPEFRSYLRRPRPGNKDESEIGFIVEPKTAYDEGLTAFEQGRPLTDNPHDSDTVDHLEWENGWFEAREANARPGRRSSGVTTIETGKPMRIFEEMESDVRGYVRSFPAVFDTAQGAIVHDEHGNRYIDFFAGAGALNYGHNDPPITEAMIAYLKRDGILHGLDKATVAKRAFLEKFRETILLPRNLSYKVQFTGPTGTNAVEAALKLARMVKRRSSIISFTDGYHGLTMGALAVTGNYFYRDESYGARNNAAFMPYDGYFGPEVNTIDYLRRFLADGSSGVDLPAAVIVETIQGEGGINVASPEWLQQLEALCREFDILLIVDDIQVGNGRTGTFFSFERAGIHPDMITVSKSIGGGLPLAMLLMRPELDQWRPGEHTGTFRGNNLAFVAATEALGYWDNDDLAQAVQYKGEILETELRRIADRFPELEPSVRGLGMVWGVDLPQPGVAEEAAGEAFQRGLLLETAGANDHVLKLLPPLVIEEDLLREGLEIVEQSLAALVEKRQKTASGID